MKKTLYLKFILAYFIFGVFGFIIVTTFVPNMTKEHLIREKAESLYSEATLIAGTYAGGLYTSETTLETVKMQLDSLAVYLNSEIRIINPSGRLVLDTTSPLDVENVVVIENFLYHPGNPVPGIPDHSDLFHRDRIYSSAEDHSCHRAVCRR